MSEGSILLDIFGEKFLEFIGENVNMCILCGGRLCSLFRKGSKGSIYISKQTVEICGGPTTEVIAYNKLHIY